MVSAIGQGERACRTRVLSVFRIERLTPSRTSSPEQIAVNGVEDSNP